MSIPETIRTNLKEAMKAKEATKVQTLRNILSAFTNELVAQKKTPQDILDDESAMAVIKRLAKQRKDAIQQFTDGGRADLAEDEQAELAILKAYLPEMMSQEQIKPVAEAKLAELGVTDKSGMGRAIGAIMGELQGKADGTDVKAVVEELLS